MQGGLFYEYESANGVPVSFEFGKERSKAAQYFQTYRRDPEKNQRINARRRWQRALKKDAEMNGKVRPLFGPHDGVKKKIPVKKKLPNAQGLNCRTLEANPRSHITSSIDTDMCEENDFFSDFFDQISSLDGRCFARNFPPAALCQFLHF